jgi:hypothetical protein
VGRPESYYARLARDAEKAADTHAHEAAKAGQYITLALDPKLLWEEKLKYFRHALRRHCIPPPFPDEDVWVFYRQLADLVRQYAGQDALRLASTEDDMYAARLALGQTRDKIEDEAEQFFGRIMGKGEECPDWFNEADWAQLKLLRDQWI